MPRSRLPFFSTVTITFTRTSGRTSPARRPLLAATRMMSCTPANVAMTSVTAGSAARAAVSARSSSATLSGAGRDSRGSSGW